MTLARSEVVCMAENTSASGAKTRPTAHQTARPAARRPIVSMPDPDNIPYAVDLRAPVTRPKTDQPAKHR